MAKAPSPNIKEKPMQPKSSRKDKEKKVQNTVQSRSTSKSKVLPDAKRGLVMTEETGNARRKIKRREGMENVGDDREDTSESAGELFETAETTNVSDAEDATEEGASISLEERTENVTEETSEVCVGDGNGDSGDGVGERTGSIRTGLPLLAEAVVSLKDIPSRTSNSDSSRSERGVEEMLDTGDFCLTKAIVEEVIPDFGNDTSYVSTCALPEVNSRNTQHSTGQVFRNLEDVLGHSYSKPGQDCDREDEAKAEPKSPVRAHLSTIDTNSGSEEAETENAASEVEADVGSDEAFREQHHEWERKSEEETTGEGDQHTMDFSEAQLDIRLECSSKNSEVTKDGSEVYSIEESTEHLGEEDNVNTLEDNDQTENESVAASDFAAQNSDGPATDQAISENSKGGAEEVLEEEEGHVSLSVALAQLLDSGCGEAEGTETLTIHSVSPGVQAGREEKKEVMEMDVGSRGE